MRQQKTQVIIVLELRRVQKWLTVVTVDGPDDHVAGVEGVLCLLPAKVAEVLGFNKVALVLLEGQPCAVDEPLASQHRNVVLLCQNKKIKIKNAWNA